MKLLQIAWASPYSLIGISVGLIGILTGGKGRVREGALEFYGGATRLLVRRLPTGPRTAGFTLGHVILGQDDQGLRYASDHERIHVKQFERWGPLMGPAYLSASAWMWLRGKDAYRDNPFEVQAYSEAPEPDSDKLAAQGHLHTRQNSSSMDRQTDVQRGSWVDWLAYLCLRCSVCLIQSVSLENCDRLSRLLAIVLADWTGMRRKVIDPNLQIAYGPLHSKQLSYLRRQMWHHLLLMVCEIAQSPRKIHRSNWREHLYMRDKEQCLRLLLDERAKVMVTGHYGNFEVAGYVLGLMGTASSTVARPLDNHYVNQYVEQFRSSTGQRILPKDGSSTAIQELLEQRGLLSLLADQHAGPKGCWVDFFGEPTSCHKALALFVLSAHAPMLVTYARRLDRPMRFEIGVTGVADPASSDPRQNQDVLASVEQLTKWYNIKLEEAIRLAPEQYWWLHRRWREVPENIKKKLLAKRQRTAESA